MATKKKAAAKPTAEPAPKAEKKPEPHEVNSSLSSPRMRALLEAHRKMGARP